MEERTFADSHGVEVLTRWWPVEAPRGTVLISHGASEHSERYDRFARALNAAGLAAVAVDHRGHGRTAAATGVGVMGPGSGEAVVDDLHELRAQAATAFGSDLPVLLFGHSMGALIALAYLTRHSAGLAGAVICGMPASVDDAPALGEVLQGFASMRDEPAGTVLTDHNAPFEPARTPHDWLSRDPAEVDRYVADPMCGDEHPLTYGYLIDLFGVVAPACERLDAISCPVFVIAGDHDPAAGMGAHASRLAEALKAAGVAADLTLYADARHELLNETNRDEVTADVVSWLEARLAPPGGSAGG
ncbi:MAG TPA: alpha/beta hydrolase [Acidimicrobiia bacterium]|nr:alpha/beta hydrolase [Acidimicrobiia bacterium]